MGESKLLQDCVSPGLLCSASPVPNVSPATSTITLLIKLLLGAGSREQHQANEPEGVDIVQNNV